MKRGGRPENAAAPLHPRQHAASR